jgi:hypothetical protein
MNKKYILTATIIVIIGAGAYFALNRQKPPSSQTITNFEECAQAGYPIGQSYPRQCWTPDGGRFVEELDQNPPPASEPITVSGELICLPKIGRGPQTLECAIGLQGIDGRRYGLKNLSELDPEYNRFSVVGLLVEVSGIFNPEEIKGPDGNVYDVVGIIDEISIKEIGN